MEGKPRDCEEFDMGFLTRAGTPSSMADYEAGAHCFARRYQRRGEMKIRAGFLSVDDHIALRPLRMFVRINYKNPRMCCNVAFELRCDQLKML